MYGRHCVGARQHDPLIAGQARRVDRGGIESGIQAQQAEPREMFEFEPVAVGAAVDRRRQHHEVFRGQPREQRVAVGDAEQSVLHRSEVVDHQVDLGDGRPDLALQCRRHLGAATVDLDLGPRFDHVVRTGFLGDAGQHAVGVTFGGQRGMDEQVDAEAVPVEDQPHRVDQERHVLGDEQQDRAVRPPPVTLEAGRQHLHEDLARLTAPAEAQVRVPAAYRSSRARSSASSSGSSE